MGRRSKYRAGCLSSIACIAAVLILASTSGESIGYKIGAGIACLILADLAVKWARKRRRTRALKSSQEATALADKLMAGSPIEPFILYLRPFYADRISVKNPSSYLRVVMPLHLVEERVTWEFLQMRRLEKMKRVIAIGGGKLGMPGADRVIPNRFAWQRYFAVLAVFADAIVMYPSARGSSLWELEWLKRESLLDKCVFVVPDNFDNLVSFHSGSLSELRAAFQNLNIALPGSLFGGGAIFAVNADGTLREALGGADLGSWYIAHAVKRLMRPRAEMKRPDFAETWARYGRVGSGISSSSLGTEVPAKLPVSEGGSPERQGEWLEQQLE